VAFGNIFRDIMSNDWIEANNTLIKLDISRNELDSIDIEEILDSIDLNSSLYELNLFLNKGYSYEEESITELKLKKNKRLVDLRLFNTYGYKSCRFDENFKLYEIKRKLSKLMHLAARVLRKEYKFKMFYLDSILPKVTFNECFIFDDFQLLDREQY